MQKKKIKIFLAAYLNAINAQNINCLSIAKHLDKEKFDVYALSLYSAPQIKTDAKLFHCFYPFRFSSVIGYIWGIWQSDVVYIPKHISTPNWMIFLAKLLGKKRFTTIEANMCDQSKASMIGAFGGKEKLERHFRDIPNIFAITKHILQHANCGVKLKEEVLYLGVEADRFQFYQKDRLQNIVFIGNLKKNKNVNEILWLAKEFNELQFYIVGDGQDREELEKIATDNVRFLGRINHAKLAQVLSSIDLHILPSRSEGFPKVILETAAAGIPSIVYSDYGAEEWISHQNNGFVVESLDEIKETISTLLKKPDLLQKNALGAFQMSKKFDWKIVIKDWEHTINNLS